MKVAIIALVLAVSLAGTEAFWGWGGMYGGMMGMGYGMMGMGYGMYGMGMWGKRGSAEKPVMDEITKMALKRTECVFTNETNMLSCRGPTGVVECQVEHYHHSDYKMFGISQVSESPVSYELVPRKLDNSAWEWLMVDGKKVKLSLWSSEYKGFGLRVEENVCFDKMTALLKSSVRNEKIFIGSQQTYILGDLIVADKLPNISEEKLKRWFGGYGMGMGYGGYGMMGMYGGYGGYGMGYGYYGKRTGEPAMNEIELAKIMKENYKQMEKLEKRND
jgi:hypothetical protein